MGIAGKQKKSIALGWLLLGSVVSSTGMSFIWPLNTIYMHNQLGQSLTVAALVLMGNQIALMVGNWLGGILFDRWKPYNTMLIGIGANALAMGSLIFFHSWPVYGILIIVSGFANGIVITCNYSLATTVRGHKPSFVFNLLYFSGNLGLVIGTLLVGYILPLGIGRVFTVTFILLALFFLVAWRHFNVLPHRTARASDSQKVVNANRSRIILVLLALAITWAMYQQWQSNISAFMLQLGDAVKQYSFLWTLNAVIIVVFQPLLTAFDDWLLRHIRLRLTVGFVLLATSFLFLQGGHQYYWFLAAMTVLTLGEILVLPGVSSYVDLYALPAEKGYYQGQVQVFASAGRAVGPVIGARLIELTSYHAMFFIAFLIILGATGLFQLSARGRRF